MTKRIKWRAAALEHTHETLMSAYYRSSAIQADEIGADLDRVREALIHIGEWKAAGVARPR